LAATPGCGPPGTLSLADYWVFWLAHPDYMRKWRREDFESAWADFERDGLVTAGDRPKFDEKVASTKRLSFNLCPGLTLRWRARLDEAALIDRRGQLEVAFAEVVGRPPLDLHASPDGLDRELQRLVGRVSCADRVVPGRLPKARFKRRVCRPFAK
jgi:hypothetical protein